MSPAWRQPLPGLAGWPTSPLPVCAAAACIGNASHASAAVSAVADAAASHCPRLGLLAGTAGLCSPHHPVSLYSPSHPADLSSTPYLAVPAPQLLPTAPRLRSRCRPSQVSPAEPPFAHDVQRPTLSCVDEDTILPKTVRWMATHVVDVAALVSPRLPPFGVVARPSAHNHPAKSLHLD